MHQVTQPTLWVAHRLNLALPTSHGRLLSSQSSRKPRSRKWCYNKHLSEASSRATFWLSQTGTKSFMPGRRGWPSEGDGRGGCREESVTSDPRKALSRCLGQEKAGQAGTAVTLKLAQPLHMPQEAAASTCLPQLCICALSWHPSVTCQE